MSPNLLSGAARMAGSSLLRLQSDERLVALIRDGHDPAFTAVVDRYRGELLRYCGRIVGDGRAEDVVQQALLNAHTAIVSSQNDINLRPWLYRIAHNAGLNVLRSSREQVELDDRLASAGGVEEDAETRERLQAAFAAIARLPEPQRDALTLRAIEGRSHAEIAALLGVTPGAARQHLHRARTTVRAAVSAVTPYGLMARFAMAGGEPASASLLGGMGASASAGLGATVVKVSAGVLAAGAIATGTTGHVPFTGKSNRPEAAAAAQPARPPAAAPAEAAVAAPPTAVTHAFRVTPVSVQRPEDHPGRSGSSSGSSGDSHGGGSGPSGSSGSGDGAGSSGDNQAERHSGRRHGSDDSSSGSSGDDSSGDGSSGDQSSGGSDSSGPGKDSGSGSSGSGSSGSGSGSSGSDDGASSDDTTTTTTAQDAPVVSSGGDSGKDRSTSGDDLAKESGSSGSGSSGSGSSGSGGGDDGADSGD